MKVGHMSEVSWHCCSALLWSLIFWSGHVTTQTHPPTLSCPHCSHSPDSQPSCSHTSPTHTTTSDNCTLMNYFNWILPVLGGNLANTGGKTLVPGDGDHKSLIVTTLLCHHWWWYWWWEWWWWVVMIRSRDVSQCCDGNQSWSWAGTDHWWPQDRDTGAQSPAPVSRSQATLAACLALLSPTLSPAATQAYTHCRDRTI